MSERCKHDYADWSWCPTCLVERQGQTVSQQPPVTATGPVPQCDINLWYSWQVANNNARCPYCDANFREMPTQANLYPHFTGACKAAQPPAEGLHLADEREIREWEKDPALNEIPPEENPLAAKYVALAARRGAMIRKLLRELDRLRQPAGSGELAPEDTGYNRAWGELLKVVWDYDPLIPMVACSIERSAKNLIAEAERKARLDEHKRCCSSCNGHQPRAFALTCKRRAELERGQ